MLKFIFLFTLILLVLFSLLSIRAQERHLPQPYICRAPEGLIYNTVFTYKGSSFSGLMVLKKNGEAYHIVLLSKLGPSIMDFKLIENKLVFEKVPESMNKPSIHRLLKNDFNLMLLTALTNPVNVKMKKNTIKIKGSNQAKIKLNEENRVKEAENTSVICKTKASFFYINDDLIPDEICIAHRFIKMKINMSLLER